MLNVLQTPKEFNKKHRPEGKEKRRNAAHSFAE
jgi:hypothetical protein